MVLLKSPYRVNSDPRSYRGISLLPVLGKVLEWVIVSRKCTEGSEPVRVKCQICCWHTSWLQTCIWLPFMEGCWRSFARTLTKLLSKAKACMDFPLDPVFRFGRISNLVTLRSPSVSHIFGTPWWMPCCDSSLHPSRFLPTLMTRFLWLKVRLAFNWTLLTKAVRIVQSWSDRGGVEVANVKTSLMMLKARLSHSRPTTLIRAEEHGEKAKISCRTTIILRRS